MELISRRIMLAAGTAAGGLLTATSVAAEQPSNFDPVSFTVVPPRRGPSSRRRVPGPKPHSY